MWWQMPMFEVLKKGKGNFPTVESIVKIHYTGKVLFTFI